MLIDRKEFFKGRFEDLLQNRRASQCRLSVHDSTYIIFSICRINVVPIVTGFGNCCHKLIKVTLLIHAVALCVLCNVNIINEFISE